MPLSRINSASIANSAISAADIADGTITAAKIISVANTQLTGNIVSSQITSVGGSQITANTIANSAFQTGSVENYLRGANLDFGMRNRIINGAMVVAQRGTSAVTTSGSFPVDRFGALSNANDFTSQQNTTVPSNGNFVYSVSIQPTSTKTPGAGTYAAIATNVEGLNMQGLGWGTASAKPVTVSFWVRSTKTGTYSIGTKNADASRSWCQEYTINASNTWEFKTYTITGCPDGSWPLDNSRGLTLDFWLSGQNTQTSTIGSWISGNANMSSNQVNFFDSTSNVFYITGVQLEVGNSPTPFDYRSYGAELVLCQRYFWRQTGGVGIPSIGAGLCISSTNARIHVKNLTRMRASPTYSYGGNVYILQNNANGVPVTSIGATYAGLDASMMEFTCSSGLTQGNGTLVCLDNATSNYLQATAEL